MESELNTLNRPFTENEMNDAIKKLKLNKSVSSDLISNEMIRHTSAPFRKVILRLFNGCLTIGVYPWNTSITSPLHKKGDKEDPDNYRAITLGSCLGKLFSSMLLDRLINFRKSICPDPPSQLGFCAGS